MSFQAVAWALNDAPGIKPSWVAVLVVLAEAADDDGCGAWPAQDTIAYKVRKSSRQVRNDLADLERAGVIRRGDQRRVAYIPNDRRPVVYDLAMERRRDDVPPWAKHQDITGGSTVPPVPEPTGNLLPPGEGAAGSVVPSGRKPTTERPEVDFLQPPQNHPDPSHPALEETTITDTTGTGWDGMGWDDTTQNPNDETDVIYAIMTDHQVSSTLWPTGDTLSRCAKGIQWLTSSGYSVTDITQGIRARGSLAASDIKKPDLVLLQRLRDLADRGPAPQLATPTQPANPVPTRCYSGCVNGRAICGPECPDDCTSLHDPIGPACTHTGPRT